MISQVLTKAFPFVVQRPCKAIKGLIKRPIKPNSFYEIHFKEMHWGGKTFLLESQQKRAKGTLVKADNLG